MNLGEAIAITSMAFKEKTDKAGKPYILHCLRVMNNLNSNDEELNCIAVMHDLFEDTDYTQADLFKLGFSARVISAIESLTHKGDNSYEDYIKIIAINPDAIKVKLADLKDNSDITRLKGVTEKDFDRMKKYHKSFTYLNELINN